MNRLWYLELGCLEDSSTSYCRFMGDVEGAYISAVLALTPLREPSGFDWVTNAFLVTSWVVCEWGVGKVEPPAIDTSPCE